MSLRHFQRNDVRRLIRRNKFQLGKITQTHQVFLRPFYSLQRSAPFFDSPLSIARLPLIICADRCAELADIVLYAKSPPNVKAVIDLAVLAQTCKCQHTCSHHHHARDQRQDFPLSHTSFIGTSAFLLEPSDNRPLNPSISRRRNHALAHPEGWATSTHVAGGHPNPCAVSPANCSSNPPCAAQEFACLPRRDGPTF